MKRLFAMLSLVLILGLSLQPMVSAFTWDSYVGKSTWSLAVTVDETGCGGSKYTNTYTVSMQHNKISAVIGNFGHGDISGTFDGNLFSSPERSFPDGAGTTTAGTLAAEFTSDCAGFSGGYHWNYVSSYQSCSGSTTLVGSRNGGCPCKADWKCECVGGINACNDLNGCQTTEKPTQEGQACGGPSARAAAPTVVPPLELPPKPKIEGCTNVTTCRDETTKKYMTNCEKQYGEAKGSCCYAGGTASFSAPGTTACFTAQEDAKKVKAGAQPTGVPNYNNAPPRAAFTNMLDLFRTNGSLDITNTAVAGLLQTCYGSCAGASACRGECDQTFQDVKNAFNAEKVSQQQEIAAMTSTQKTTDRWFRPLLGFMEGEKPAAKIEASSHGYPVISSLQTYWTAAEAGGSFITGVSTVQGGDGLFYIYSSATESFAQVEGYAGRPGEQIVLPYTSTGSLKDIKVTPGNVPKGFSGEIKGAEEFTNAVVVETFENSETGEQWLVPKLNISENATEGVYNVTIVMKQNDTTVAEMPVKFEIAKNFTVVAEPSRTTQNATVQNTTKPGLVVEEQQKPSTAAASDGSMIFILITGMLIVVAAAGYYFLVLKKK